jgi:hypothetical protein
MGLHLGRLLLAVVAAEAVPFLLLVVLVTLFAPAEPSAVQAFSQQLALWTGSFGGALGCFLGAWWLARGLRDQQVVYGLTVGLLTALIDIAVIIASRPRFHWLLIATNGGRILAGAAGGFAGSRRAHVGTRLSERRAKASAAKRKAR